MKLWKTLFSTEQPEAVGTCSIAIPEGCLEEGAASSVLLLLPAPHSDFSRQAKSFLMNEESAACWLFPFGRKNLSFISQQQGSTGWGLRVPTA